ncbi:MAG: transketolase C-terminal domain-containing protein [SAR202 cluster bacterium]|jgi:transketolase|nr:transketolase C-terminal domain-containing protein [SAR202 cluster bacterium]|tara:strand:- start:377 stop:1357 length:981 start_codon:yes stop_codon:yes gene_type:complete
MFSKLNNKNTLLWSRIGSRATFGLLALELGKNIDDIMILTSDVSTSAGLDRFRKTYSDKFLEIGIAEQNLIGIAAGLASENYKVITTTFAPFQTMRCCEQIKVNLGYMKQKVCMIGLASGLNLGTLGYTHCSIEDLSVMRSIPNITVISPADCGETVKAICSSLKHNESVYIRLTGGANNPIVYSDDYNFEIGKSIKLKKGNDITIFSTGTMVYESLQAANNLDKEGISASVINVHTLKPFDNEIIEEMSNKSKLFVTVEEHNVIGGLSSVIAEAKSELINSPPQLSIGIPDQYSEGGEYQYLKNKYGLNSTNIAERIIKQYHNLG